MEILRMMAVHEEADVLARNLEWYSEAGFETVALLDASSADGSREICERAAADGTIAELEAIETDAHRVERLLGRLGEIAARRRPDALVLAAPDEFFEVAAGGDLRAALEEDLAAGYNLIKFWNMEFHLTRRDDDSASDPLIRMRHYSLWDLSMYRAFPWVEGLDLVRGRSHRPTFPEGTEDRPSPRRYVSRHYPLRSPEQAARKIARMRPTPEAPTATTHYLRFSGAADDEIYVDPSHLHRYDDDHAWRFDQPFMPIRLRDTARALARSELERDTLSERVAELQAANTELERRLRGSGES